MLYLSSDIKLKVILYTNIWIFNNMDYSWENLVVSFKEVYVGPCFHNTVFVALGRCCNLDTSADVKNKENLDILWLRFKIMEHRDFPGGPVVKIPYSHCSGRGLDPSPGH